MPLNLPRLTPEYTQMRLAAMPTTWLDAWENISPRQQAAIVFTMFTEYHLALEAAKKTIARLEELLAHHANHEENP